MLNAAGYYTEPTPDNVAVSLLQAQINNDPTSQDYLTQNLTGVYTDTDPRTYPLSSYSYMILPTTVQGQFTEAKGKTLGAFAYYAMCQGQQESASLGYSPMPINLVQDSFAQVRKIPGVVVQNISIQSCNNPTFSPNGTNLLADTAPQPAACDKQGPTQCATGTGGASKTPTAVIPVTVTGNTGGSGTAATTKTGGTSAATGSATTVAGATTKSTVAASEGATSGAGTGGGAAGAQQCDPDTGAGCTSTGAGGTSAANSSGQVAASPLLLTASSGWSGTQWLMLLSAFLTLALILAPGVAWRVLSKRKAR
jgi:hypothetical protein